MKTNILQTSFLRVQRQFPDDDLKDLANQIDHAYIDIAQNVNQRILGNYPQNFLSITGEKWYFSGNDKPQQSLRQVFPFTAIGNINHNLNWDAVSIISPKSCGTFTDSINWYGAIYGSSVALAGQVSFYVTPSQIVILSGAGAPAITNGLIVLEYISCLLYTSPSPRDA